MWIIASSVLLGLLGVFASRVGLTRLTADDASRDPHAYWALGLVTLLPSWLVAFIGLLGAEPGAKLQAVSGGGLGCSPSFLPG
jgi:amino acid transporter